jgi:hypothetical protein
VIEPQYTNAVSFSTEGLAAVMEKDKWGFIDRSGQFVIQPQFSQINNSGIVGLGPVLFAGGLAPVADETGLFGYIDQKGQFVIEPRFVWAEGFKHGVAEVQQVQAGGARQLGYINLKGEFVWGPVEIDKAWQGPWWY